MESPTKTHSKHYLQLMHVKLGANRAWPSLTALDTEVGCSRLGQLLRATCTALSVSDHNQIMQQNLCCSSRHLLVGRCTAVL